MKINNRQILKTAIAAIVGIALLGSGFWLGWTEACNIPENDYGYTGDEHDAPAGFQCYAAPISAFSGKRGRT